jgi:hypothetical protein
MKGLPYQRRSKYYMMTRDNALITAFTELYSDFGIDEHDIKLFRRVIKNIKAGIKIERTPSEDTLETINTNELETPENFPTYREPLSNFLKSYN